MECWFLCDSTLDLFSGKGDMGGKGKEFMEMMGGNGGKMPDMMENMGKPSLMGKPSKPGKGKPSKGEMVQQMVAEKKGLCLSQDEVVNHF